jgi:hypothetical protein
MLCSALVTFGPSLWALFKLRNKSLDVAYKTSNDSVFANHVHKNSSQ